MDENDIVLAPDGEGILNVDRKHPVKPPCTALLRMPG